MNHIPAFQTLRIIGEDSRMKLCRAVLRDSGKLVLIKIAKGEDSASAADQAYLLREFELAGKLEAERIAKPAAFRSFGRSPALMYDDDGSITLRAYMTEKTPMDQGEFLPLAKTIAEAVLELHRSDTIHLDLRPDNILVHPAASHVRLTGLGYAISVGAANPERKDDAHMIVDRLPYASPEHSGRMRQSVDERSDLYSLGVIYYEMLTGRLPFQAEEPLEWIHAHLAQSPLPFASPGNSSAWGIVMKLLEKNAGNRYPNCSALLADLNKSGELQQPFVIQDGLYGREHEMALLSQAFQSTCFGSTEIVYVSGEAGVGKTSLLDEAFRKEQRLPRSPYYITGKFEQIPKDSPYHPIIQAFRGLMRHLLGESSDKIEAWRSKLRAALRFNEAVIGAIIPELKQLVGDMAAVEELPPEESKKRFVHTFCHFAQALASREHPLVLFIDDLQWADTSSLQLIHALLCDPESQYVMFVGAYRDAETGSLQLPGYAEDGCVTEEVIVRHIRLGALTMEQMNGAVADTLRCADAEAMPLTEFLFHKSGGNPLYFKQMFRRLHDDRLLRYNHGSRRWQWNLGQLIERESDFDVGDLVAYKLKRFSGAAHEMLRMAACIGSEFRPGLIADVAGRDTAEVLAELSAIADEGFVSPLGPDKYRFLHDSIQKIMYGLMDEETRQRTHLAIGRRLTEAGRDPERLFEAVNHLNIGSARMSERQQLRRLAEMNLTAGNEAKASTAYDIALVYYRKGVELLHAEDWNGHFDLCFELHAERAECEYLCGNHEATEQLADHLLPKARNPIERARVQKIRIDQCIHLGKHIEATAIGFKSLKEFGIFVPPNPPKARIAYEIMRVEVKLRDPFKLARLPEITDHERIAAIEMMFAILEPSFFTNKQAYFVLLCRAIRFLLKYGNTAVSAAFYSAYGVILGVALGKYKRGYEFAKVGVELSERYNVTSIKSKTYMIFGGVLCQFVGTAREGDFYLKEALRFGLESKDYAFSSYAMGARVNSLYTRAPLSELSGTIREYLNVLAETKDEFVLQNFHLLRQFVMALQGKTAGPCAFDSDDFEEKRFMERIYDKETFATTLFQYNTYKAQLCYLTGQYEEAERWSHQAATFAAHAISHLPECLFYDSLAIASVYGQSSLHRRKRLKRLRRNLRRFRQWSKWNAEKFMAKLYLIEAELARATKRFSAAEAGYDRAIREAREQGNIQVESIASEVAAQHYVNQGKERAALSYLQSACDGYKQWGASVKARQVAERIALLQGISEAAAAHVDERPQTSHAAAETAPDKAEARQEANAADWIDLAAILKASQALTDKMDLDAVLAEIMSALMSYAGARKGAILTEYRGDLALQIRADAEVHVLAEPAQPEEGDVVPTGIARYVARTQEPVHYGGDGDSWLHHSPYMAKHRPQSALCLPVFVHRAAVGVLYLENHSPGVVSPERIKILHAMASQGVYICELLRSLSVRDGEADAEKATGKTPAVIEEPLTDREMEVLALLAAGLSNKEIADRLVVAVGTVKVHVKNIFTKLKVNRRTKAIAQAKELQLLN